MACTNIIDHRHHKNDPRCDAVLETVKPKSWKSHMSWIPDVTYVTKTTVAQVIQMAQTHEEDLCVCLYDPGSITRQEIKSTKPK